MFDIDFILKFRNFFGNLKNAPLEKDLISTRTKIDDLKTKLLKLKTPSSVMGFYSLNGVEYKADGIDYTKEHDFFVYNKGGDCDDYAEFAYKVLSECGYDCHKLYLFSKNVGHVVTIAIRKDNGNIFILNNDVMLSRLTSIDDACDAMLGEGYDGYFLR